MECQLSKGLTRPLSKGFTKQLKKYKWVHNKDKPTTCRWCYVNQEWLVRLRVLKKVEG